MTGMENENCRNTGYSDQMTFMEVLITANSPLQGMNQRFIK
jgi:hypothetical protein